MRTVQIKENFHVYIYPHVLCTEGQFHGIRFVFFDHQLSCTRTQTDTVIIPSRKDIPTDFLQESI